MKELFLLKYGEVALKGLNRSTFESRLMSALRHRLRTVGDFRISSAQSTVYVEPVDEYQDNERAFEICSRLFGIASLSRAVMCEKDPEAIANLAVEYALPILQSYPSFKVEAKRSDKRFPMTSPELCAFVGGKLLSADPHLRVNVREPGITLYVEVRDFGAYIHAGRFEGAGGLPPGCGGRAALLLSGGIDSPVAGYMMAKRGLSLTCVHFASPPYTSEQAEEKVCELAAILADYADIDMLVVPFTEQQLAIRDLCPEDMATLIFRRMMMRTAERLVQSRGCKALITGESLGQVASQTLDGLCVSDSVCHMPVFRPLIGMDKTEITAIARKIGTFETSILPYEDCCTVFTPKHPRTRPDEDYARESEANLPVDELVEKAVREAYHVRLSRKYLV